MFVTIKIIPHSFCLTLFIYLF